MIRKLLLTSSCLLALYANGQDDCNSALTISAGLHNVTVINGTEVPTPICASTGPGATVGEWFKYIPTEDYQVTVSSDIAENNGSGDTRFHVYIGSCGNLTCIAGDDDAGDTGSGLLSIDTFSVTQGETYYIAFDNRWNAAGFYFELTEAPPLPPGAISFSIQGITTSGSNMALVDMNGDHLDDMVSINPDFVNVQFQEASGGFTERNIPTPQTSNLPFWSMAAGDYNDDGYNDLVYGSGSAVSFMYTNVDASAIDNGNPFDDVSNFSEVAFPQYVFSQRSNFIDINNDGHLDAFMCHDVEPNVFFINDGNGNLTYHQGGLGDYFSGGNYGSIWIDYDNDKDMDMFIAKCGGDIPRRTNQMHTNNGDGTYTENAALIGLADPMQTWSAAWGDFDNDGDMDVMVGASSGPHKLMRNDDGIFIDVTSTSGLNALSATSIEHVTYDLDNDGNLDVVSGGNVLLGNGDLTFDLYPSLLSGGGGAYGDLNNDGFIDGFNGSTMYINNANNNNWVTINTVGTASNNNGIGARVEVHTANGVKIRDVRSGEGFRYMSTLNTHVGLGTEASITSIVIYWPSGIIDTVNNPNINTSHTVIEGSTLSVLDPDIAQLSLHPNPAVNYLQIDTPVDLAGHKVIVYNVNGKRMLQQTLKSNRLDVSSLGTGMYLLQLESDGNALTKKFIKQ